MTTANEQPMIGGDHYRQVDGEQHWDRVARLGLNYFQACATKYIERCYLKSQTLDDLKKARHFIDKLIDLETQKAKQDEATTTTPKRNRSVVSGSIRRERQ